MRLGIFSDAHGHVEGYLSARKVLLERGVDRIFYLGDAVGYIPDPGVVRLLIEDGFPWVMGNHERMLLDGRATPDAEDVYRHMEVREQLSESELQVIANLPVQISEVLSGRRCLFVHGSPRHPTNEYVYPDSDLSPFTECGASFVFMGHTHRPFVRVQGETTFVNVGSCGMPRDGVPVGRVVICDLATCEVEFVDLAIADGSRRILETIHVSRPVQSALEKVVGEGFKANGS